MSEDKFEFSFEPYLGSSNVKKLDEGVEFQCLVTLHFVIKVFEESNNESTLYLEQKHLHPFDDIVLSTNDSFYIFSVKKNDPGTFKNLASRLEIKKSSKNTEYENVNFKRIVTTYINEIPKIVETDILFEYPIFQYQSDMLENVSLPDYMIGNYIHCVDRRVDLERKLEEWFCQMHGSHGQAVFRSALNEIKDRKNSDFSSFRKITSDVAREILQFEKLPIKQRVNDLSRLIQRPQIIREILSNFDENKVVLLTGEPGSGKSAILDQLAVQLEKENKSVRRHSFFISPSDEFRAERLTFNFFNMALSTARSKHRSRHVTALTSNHLINSLKNIEGEQYIIIDGIDHVQRDNLEELNKIGYLLNSIISFSTVKFILSIQSETQLPDNLSGASFANVRMPKLHKNEINEIVNITRNLTSNLNDEVIDLLYEKCSQNPLLLSYIINSLGESILVYSEVEDTLSDMPTPKDVMEYVENLIHGMNKSTLTILLFLSNLHYGFSKTYFHEVSLTMGIKPIDVNEIWHSVNHVFKRIGPKRFLIWHYSFEKVISNRGLTPLDTKKFIKQVNNSYDCRLYNYNFNYNNDNLESFATDVKEDALNLRLNPMHAENVIYKFCEFATENSDLSSFLKCSSQRFPIYKLIHNHDFEDYAYEALSISNNDDFEASLLFDGVGYSIIRKFGETKDLMKYSLNDAELRWLIADTEPDDQISSAGHFALLFCSNKFSFDEIINKIQSVKWAEQETPAAETNITSENRTSDLNCEIAYIVGRILALNTFDGAILDSLKEGDTSIETKNIILENIVLGMCQTNLALGNQSFLNSIINIQPRILSSLETIYLYPCFQLDYDLKFIEDFLKTLDIEKIIAEQKDDYFKFAESVKPIEMKIISSAIAFYLLDDYTAYEKLKEEIIKVTRLKSSALYDIIDIFVPNIRNWQRGVELLIDRIEKQKRVIYYTTDKIRYKSEISRLLLLTFKMGLISIHTADDFEWINKFTRSTRWQKDIRLDILSYYVDRDFFNNVITNLEDEFRSRKKHNPYEWKRNADRLAALHALSKNYAKSTQLGIESYNARYLYQGRKDGYVFLILDTLNVSRRYLPKDIINKNILKIAGYLPVIDDITDGAGERHWFSDLMAICYEEASVIGSQLLQYVSNRISEEGNEGYWLWRMGDFLSTQLEHLCGENLDDWIGMIGFWFFESAPWSRIKPRSDYEFIYWVIRSVDEDDFWDKSELGEALKEGVFNWCTGFVSAFSEKIAMAKTSNERLHPDFEKTYAAAEKLIGMKPRFQLDEFRYVDNLNEKTNFKRKLDDCLSDNELSLALQDPYFWTPKYVAGEHKDTLKAVNSLKKKSDIEIKEYLLDGLMANFMVRDYNNIDYYSAKIARMLGELKLNDELVILLDKMTENFIGLFRDLEPDLEFSETLSNVGIIPNEED